MSSYEQHLFSSRQTQNKPLYIVLNSFSKVLINCSCCENVSDILGLTYHKSEKKYSSQRKVFLIIFWVRKLLHEAGIISQMTNGLKVFITQYPLDVIGMSYVPEHLSFYFQVIVVSQNQLAYSSKLRSTIITWTYFLEFLHILDSIRLSEIFRHYQLFCKISQLQYTSKWWRQNPWQGMRNSPPLNKRSPFA